MLFGMCLGFEITAEKECVLSNLSILISPSFSLSLSGGFFFRHGF